MSKYADRVYRNKDDTRRARVFRREDGRWDWDLFKKHALNGGWTVEEGWCGCSTTRTLKDALRWLEDVIGTFTPINGATVTEGWPEKAPPKVTKDAAIKIEAGQIWRQGSRRLRVDWVAPHWNESRAAGILEVGCHFIEPSGRERGSMIKGRNSARQRYGEQRFREKFRYVPPEPERLANDGGSEWLTGCPKCGGDPNHEHDCE